MKRFISLFIAIVMVGLVFSIYPTDTAPKASDTMTTYTEKATYAYGESVTIYLQNLDAAALGKSAWLGVYKGTDQIGTQSKIWVMLTDANGNLTAGAQRGYFTFPQDMEGGGWISDKRNFEIGDYTVRIVSNANKNLGTDYTFHVQRFAETDQSAYSLGDSVTVTCPDFDAAELGKNAWLGIYHESYTAGSVYWVYLTDADGNLTEGAQTSFTFPEDAEGGGWKGKELSSGNCTVKIFNASSKAISGYGETSFTVGPRLSLEKTAFDTDEEVKISFDCVSTSIGKNAWLAIYAADATIGTDGNRMYVYLTDASSNLKHGSSGTINFPNMRDGGAWTLGQHLPAGEYKAILLGGAGYDHLSNMVYFTVKSPSITLDKQTFKVGEPVTLSYANVGQYLLGSNSVDWVSIDIFTATGIVGTSSSVAGYHIYSREESITRTPSGSIAFPTGDYRNGANFPLTPGDYYVVLRSTNTAIDGTKVPFTVTSPFKSIQPELTNSIALHYAVELGDSITSDVSMKFTMNDASVDVPGTLEGGLWKFTFDGILPQDMGAVVQSDLYIAGVKKASYEYSVATYCRKQLENTTGTTEKDNAFRALLVAMLNYGTEAQQYFDQAVDGYVNADVDQAHLTQYNYTLDQATDCTNVDKNANTGDFVWKAATLGLYDEIKIRIKFYAATTDNLTVKVNGAEYTAFTPCGTDLYYVYIPVYAHQFADALQITFDQNGSAVGTTLTYSVNSYIHYAKDLTDVYDIVNAIYQYGCSAKYYVSQQ